MKLSEELAQMHACADYGQALAGIPERVAALEAQAAELDEINSQAPAVLLSHKGRPQWNPDYNGPLVGQFYARPASFEAYGVACDALEAAIAARIKAGFEPGPQGSLVEAVEWAYQRLDALEAACLGFVRKCEAGQARG